MKYSTLHTTIQTLVVTNLGLDFIESSDDRVNNYAGDFPLVVLNPPEARIENVNDRLSVMYDVGMWFMALKPQDNTYETIQALVEAQWDNAASFIREWVDRGAPEPINKGVISPFYSIRISAHITAGVYLQFEIETIDDLAC